MEHMKMAMEATMMFSRKYEGLKMKIAEWLADPENSEHDLFNFLMDDCGIGEYYDECVAQRNDKISEKI